jgi:enamine deaminase RidA (YjgF/YER057c/UK114 family)
VAQRGTFVQAGCAARQGDSSETAAKCEARLALVARASQLILFWLGQAVLAYRLLIGWRKTMHGQVETKRVSWLSASPSSPRLWPAPPAGARPLIVGSLRRGCEWQDELGHFCLLTDVAPVLGNASRAVQTMMVFDQLEALLERAGFTFDQVVRTWFFLDDILSWYGDFNRVRTKFYSERGLLGRSPASTAVGVPNPQRQALKAHLLAFRPNGGKATVHLGTSPLQGAAFDYGSAFSRAMCLEWPEGKQLYVSGTASIDGSGKTLFPGQILRQLKETFRVVQSLLEHHGLQFCDVKLATAYFPNASDEKLVRACWEQHLELDFASMQADICRRDLRFELELMAEHRAC